jgi:hypothetical protein
MKHIALLAGISLLSLLIACATPPPGKTRVLYSDDGLSEITLAGHWGTRPNFGKNADLRASDDTRGTYLMVNTYRPEDVKPMTLEKFSETLSSALRDNMQSAQLSSPRALTIGGRPAIEYEVRGAVGDIRLVYLSTVVDGRTARYHLVGWTQAEQFPANRDGLRLAAQNFRESDKPRPAKVRQSLTFQWPESLTSRVTFRNSETKRGEQFGIQGQLQTTVKPSGKENLQVSTKVINKKITSSPNKNKETDAYLQDVLKAVLTDIPDYTVSRDGDFVGIVNLADYHKRIQHALIEGLPKGNPDGRAMAEKMIKTMLGEQTLALLMEDEWNNVVGNWAGGSYTVGEQYEFTQSYQSPALGKRTFPMVVTQQLAGSTPCKPGSAVNNCVRLVQTSRVASEGFSRAMEEFLRKTVGQKISVEKMEVSKTIEIITDPKTLLPYRTQKKEVKSMAFSIDGKTQPSEEVSESFATYSY